MIKQLDSKLEKSLIIKSANVRLETIKLIHRVELVIRWICSR